MDRERAVRTVGETLQQYCRGLIGGLFFSLPLLYTMEMWWAGFILSPLRLAIGFAVTMMLLALYNLYAGIRRDESWGEVLVDCFEEIGLAVLFSAAMLWMLGRFHSGMEHTTVLGQIAVEAMVVAVGISIGTEQLNTQESEKENREPDRQVPSWGVVVLAACGAFIVAANVAATEEVPMIAMECSAWQLLALTLASMGLGAIMMSGMVSGDPLWEPDHTLFDRVLAVMLPYAVGLGISALVLWFLGRFEGQQFSMAVAQLIVLGLPAALGAFAGRILLR